MYVCPGLTQGLRKITKNLKMEGVQGYEPCISRMYVTSIVSKMMTIDGVTVVLFIPRHAETLKTLTRRVLLVLHVASGHSHLIPT